MTMTNLPKRALLLERVHPDAVSLLSQAGFEVTEMPSALGEDELIAALPGVSVLGIRSKTTVTERVLSSAPDLLVIGAFCIGTNQIDLSAAAAHGVAVFNAPFSNTRSVVELAIGHVIALLRKSADKSMRMHQGIWDKSADGCHEVRGKTLGIVGYGNIGAQLSVLAESLGMKVIFFDITHRLPMGTSRAVHSLQELLAEADVVSVHVDGRPGRPVISASELAQMKQGSYLINLSRGHTVDVDALAESIKSGHLAGAAVDVFPVEPNNGEPFVSPLIGLSNVILTPHIGGSTEEAQQDIGSYCAGRIVDHVATGSTDMCVNLPQVPARRTDGTYRIAHLHANVPGILAKINEVLASRGMNIVGQFLKTDERTGYVVTDVAMHELDGTLEALASIPSTIRSRLVY